MRRGARIAVGVVLALALGAGALYGAVRWYLGAAARDPALFESAIAEFEAADAEAMPAPGGIVFVGSSSIRFWETLAEDMAPLPVVRRGFGGAHMSHVVHNARRIVTPYAPRAVVVFVGGNDVASGKSADEVADDYADFLAIVREDLPETDVWILSSKPSKLRWGSWPELRALDVRLRAFADADPRVRFVETGRTLLGPDGTPDDVYVFDGLHLNAEGYRRWTASLRPRLLEAYPDLAGS